MKKAEQIARIKLRNGTKIEKRHAPKLKRAILESIIPAIDYVKKAPTQMAVDYAVSLMPEAPLMDAVKAIARDIIPIQGRATQAYLGAQKAVPTLYPDIYGFFGDLGEYSEEAAIWAQMVGKWERENGAKILKSIIETNKDQARNVIREAIDQAIAEGLDLYDTGELLERVILQEWRIQSVFQAARIARTETFKALNWSAFETAKSTGLDLVKIWMTNLDGREREAHANANGQIVDLAQPFKVGDESMMYPTGGAIAGNNINCRCQCAEVVRKMRI